MITNSLNIAKDTNLKRATKSLLEELNSITVKKDNEAVIESRATHVINSAINLLAIIKENFPEEQAYELERRFINSIKGGNIPREFIPSVEKGFKEAMKNGPLAGFEMDAMKVTLKDGSFHAVDSDSLSFELAAKIGFKNAAKGSPLTCSTMSAKIEYPVLLYLYFVPAGKYKLTVIYISCMQLVSCSCIV